MTLKNRILQNIKINEATKCWEWQKCCVTGGYGGLKINGKMKRAHRLAYELFNGPIPIGLLVCHSCDNPPCCNPDHLFLGTAQDNVDDMWEKGRQGNFHVPHPNLDQRGSKHPNAKLTEEDVIEIRILLTKGELQRIIAEHFGVSIEAISQIKTGRRWKHTLKIEDKL